MYLYDPLAPGGIYALPNGGDWSQPRCNVSTLLGHQTPAAVSQLLSDRGGRFLVAASGTRGWHWDYNQSLLGYDICSLTGADP